MSLIAGATNGPTDMSVTVNFYTIEAGILVGRLPAVDEANAFRARLVAAEQGCEQQGTTMFSMLLSPFEQGLAMAATSGVTCQFCSGLRVRVQTAMVQKLNSLGARLDF